MPAEITTSILGSAPPSKAMYDSSSLYEAYSVLSQPRNVNMPRAEWPRLLSMLGLVKDTTILELGCGFGWFCRWASEHGAARVVGVDNSRKMLERAEAINMAPEITYICRDLDSLESDAKNHHEQKNVLLGLDGKEGASEGFDTVFSALAFHYIEHLQSLCEAVHAALKPGGRFLFSFLHPVWTATDNGSWQERAQGEVFWPLSNYSEEGWRVNNWIKLDGGVRVYQRTMDTYFSILRDCGFDIFNMGEWMFEEGSFPEEHVDAGNETHRPFFLLVGARKRDL
ncbi:S-adenosyl-L-methionine-dependent methyltransferase [Aspergillus karnatakaensis]|uniref:class I SAM-dependent methyltransferase n=1 Tax=Aspergillus karnatakaensis TaxID=1810916 RepID=UPI003CCD5D58